MAERVIWRDEKPLLAKLVIENIKIGGSFQQVVEQVRKVFQVQFLPVTGSACPPEST
jgi:hypothetical protein